MENASKAILIAGAVLIVLLVVSLMMYFLSTGNNLVDTFGTDLTKTQMKDHNNRFLLYDGEISGTEVIAALTKVMSELQKDDGIPMVVTCKPKVTENTVYTLKGDNKGAYAEIVNRLEKTLLYKVTLTYNSEGLINGLNIVPKN